MKIVDNFQYKVARLKSTQACPNHYNNSDADMTFY